MSLCATSLWCLITLLLTVHADELQKRLLHDLLLNYDRRILPTSTYNETLEVKFSLSLLQVLDLDERNQVLATYQYIGREWWDNEMVWKPEDYGGIELTSLPYDSVWHPDITLFNNVDIAFSQQAFYPSNIQIFHTGHLQHYLLMAYKSSCTVYVRYFPFDTQNCTLTFGSWSYYGSQLNLTLSVEPFTDDSYIPSTEFDLQDVFVFRFADYNRSEKGPIITVDYHVVLKRKSMFYVFNLLLPCSLITMVAMLAFCIPSEAGEKLSLGITVLLSMTVFLLLVSDQMPPSSNHIPLIAVFYFMMMVLVMLSTAMSVFTLNLHHRGPNSREVPIWLQRFCFCNRLSRILCLPVNSNQHASETEMQIRAERRNIFSTPKAKEAGDASQTNTMRICDVKLENDANTSRHELGQQICDSMQAIVRSFQWSEDRAMEKEKEESTIMQWRQVACVIDRLLFFLFMTVTVTILVGVTLSAVLH